MVETRGARVYAINCSMSLAENVDGRASGVYFWSFRAKTDVSQIFVMARR